MKKGYRILLSVLFWLGLWTVLYFTMQQPLLIPSPLSVFRRVLELGQTALFWKSIVITLARVMLGFFLGLVLGIITAYFTSKVPFIRTLLAPLLQGIKATPVASFIVLAIIWLSVSKVPVLTAVLVVLPNVWANMEAGISNLDPKLKEMGKVYAIPSYQIVLPQLRPHLQSAVKNGMGMAWKAGIAAEVICPYKDSIGSSLHTAKITLETTDVFAWTAVVILLSVLLEKVVVALSNIQLPFHGSAVKTPLAGVLKTTHLTKTFPGKPVLEDFSIAVPEGEVTCISGPSGCGKTTLLNAMLEQTEATVSYLFQEDRLLPWLTVQENLEVVGIPTETVKNVLSRIGLSEEAKLLPDQLSGGMQRKLALARALCYAGTILFLDEPLQGLDEDSREDMVRFIKEERKNRTTVLISHHQDEVDALANQVIFVEGPPLHIL